MNSTFHLALSNLAAIPRQSAWNPDTIRARNAKLSPEQRILLAIESLPTPCSVPDVSDKAALSYSRTAVVLRMLAKNGVLIAEKVRRDGWRYRIAEVKK